MDGYIIDTSALSAYLDPAHEKHEAARRIIDNLDQASPKFISAIALAEISFGIKLVEVFEKRLTPALAEIIREARKYAVLDITHHTANSYAELKANLAKKYLKKANRRNRPKYLENWVDKNSGQRLVVDENDLWMCAQAKERDLIMITDDKGFNRIALADPEVRIRMI